MPAVQASPSCQEFLGNAYIQKSLWRITKDSPGLSLALLKDGGKLAGQAVLRAVRFSPRGLSQTVEIPSQNLGHALAGSPWRRLGLCMRVL